MRLETFEISSLVRSQMYALLNDGGFWWNSYGTVIAWAELPEPYTAPVQTL